MQILTLRRLIDGIKSKNLPATITFVDFRKAFDSIHRGKLMEILKAYGFPVEVDDVVNMMYTVAFIAIDWLLRCIYPDPDPEYNSAKFFP